jgi:hypothetical protein
VLAFLQDVSWTVVVALALILGIICFLAVLWSKREWNSRKIRIGMFLEREYMTRQEEAEDDEDTKNYGPDEWPTKHD